LVDSLAKHKFRAEVYIPIYENGILKGAEAIGKAEGGE
jgi:hypothetical protein